MNCTDTSGFLQLSQNLCFRSVAWEARSVEGCYLERSILMAIGVMCLNDRAKVFHCLSQRFRAFRHRGWMNEIRFNLPADSQYLVIEIHPRSMH